MRLFPVERFDFCPSTHNSHYPDQVRFLSLVVSHVRFLSVHVTLYLIHWFFPGFPSDPGIKYLEEYGMTQT